MPASTTERPAQVLVRADASSTTGLGHVMRSLTLAQALDAAGLEVRFEGSGLPAEVTRRLPSTLGLCGGPKEPGGRLDGSSVAGKEPDLAIVDGYHFGADFFEVLEEAGTSYAVIDDNGDTPARAPTLVLNQNPHAEAGLYRHLAGAPSLLLGLEYALLRPELVQLAGEPSVQHRDGVLVAMGGSDPLGLTTPIAQAVASGDRPVLAALGPSHPQRDRVVRHLAGVSGVRVVEPDEYLRTLATCEIAVLAAGSSLWEAACLGTPTVGVIVAENQRRCSRAALQQGLIASLADATIDTPDTVASLVAARVRAGTPQPHDTPPIDGRGAERAAEAIGSRIQTTSDAVPSAELTMRPATRADADFLRSLRNESDVVSASRTDQPVDAATHAAWLSNSLASRTRRLFVVCLDSQPIGQARLDSVADGEWVSIALAADYRGKGLGTEVLRTVKAVARGDLLAEVRKANERSLALFRRCGFADSGSDQDFVHLRWAGARERATYTGNPHKKVDSHAD